MEADSNDRFADRAFNFNDPLYCLRVRIKQPFIFTTWTSHMHFLHIFSPPARGQPKGNVKLTVDDCFIFLCTVFRDLVPMVAINIVYRTCVLLSIIFALPRKSWRSFIRLKFTSDLYTNFIYSAGNVPDDYSQLHPHPPFYEYRYEISVFSDFSSYIALGYLSTIIFLSAFSTHFSGSFSLTLNRLRWRTAR